MQVGSGGGSAYRTLTDKTMKCKASQRRMPPHPRAVRPKRVSFRFERQAAGQDCGTSTIWNRDPHPHPTPSPTHPQATPTPQPQPHPHAHHRPHAKVDCTRLAHKHYPKVFRARLTQLEIKVTLKVTERLFHGIAQSASRS